MPASGPSSSDVAGGAVVGRRGTLGYCAPETLCAVSDIGAGANPWQPITVHFKLPWESARGVPPPQALPQAHDVWSTALMAASLWEGHNMVKYLRGMLEKLPLWPSPAHLLVTPAEEQLLLCAAMSLYPAKRLTAAQLRDALTPLLDFRRLQALHADGGPLWMGDWALRVQEAADSLEAARAQHASAMSEQQGSEVTWEREEALVTLQGHAAYLLKLLLAPPELAAAMAGINVTLEDLQAARELPDDGPLDGSVHREIYDSLMSAASEGAPAAFLGPVACESLSRVQPLHLAAASSSSPEQLRWLLQVDGVDVNRPNWAGETPLQEVFWRVRLVVADRAKVWVPVAARCSSQPGRPRCPVAGVWHRRTKERQRGGQQARMAAVVQPCRERHWPPRAAIAAQQPLRFQLHPRRPSPAAFFFVHS